MRAIAAVVRPARIPTSLALLCVALAAACSGGGGEDVADGGVDAGPDAGPPPPKAFIPDTRISPETSIAVTSVANGPTAVDYDGDGDVDLVVGGGYSPGGGFASGLALLRNDGTGGFTDVAQEAGLTASRAFSTIAALDYDNDGDPDLFAAAAETFADGIRSADGPDVLYRNDGDGTFTDVTAAAGIAETGTDLTIAAGDIDDDGLLDLYLPVGIDGDFFERAFNDPENPELQADPDLLFHNNGDGTFTEESALRGVGVANTNVGHVRLMDDQGMAALFIDDDGDGDLDLLVANMGGYVLHYQNTGGVFADDSAASGVQAALGWSGFTAFAPMDLDGDGRFEIVVANVGTSYLAHDAVSQEPADFKPLAAVLKREGAGTFEEIAAGVAVSGLPDLPRRDPSATPQDGTLQLLPWGFGLSPFDFDNDGLEDLYQTGSFATAVNIGIVGTADDGAYPGALLHRTGAQTFTDVTVEDGVADLRDDGFILPSWGNTFADLDGDGQLDIVVGNQRLPNFPAGLAIFRNDLRNLGVANNWIAFHLQGTASNRDGIGAEVRLFVTTDAAPQLRGSFITGWVLPHDPLYFGLGAASSVARVEVTWPSGTVQVLTDLAAGQIVQVVEP